MMNGDSLKVFKMYVNDFGLHIYRITALEILKLSLLLVTSICVTKQWKKTCLIVIIHKLFDACQYIYL